jgi:hypothetical protein
VVDSVPVLNGGVLTKVYQETTELTFKRGRLPRLVNFNMSFDYSFNPAAAKSRNDNLNQMVKQQAPQVAGRTPEETEKLAAVSRDPNAFVDFNIPWNINVSYSFRYDANPLSTSSTSSIVSNTLNFSGDFNLDT